MLKSALTILAFAATALAPAVAAAQQAVLPAFMLDTTCPNAIASETRVYELGKTDAPVPGTTDRAAMVHSMAAVAPAMIPALSNVSDAFDVCAAGYSRPDQTTQAYHARVRAAQARFLIAVFLLSERKIADGRATLELADVAVADVMRAPVTAITPEDQSFAGDLSKLIKPMLAYVVKSGEAFDPLLMFPPGPAPVPY